MAKSDFDIFDLFGLHVRLNPSWFLIAALIVWSLSQRYFPGALPGLGTLGYVGLGIAAMLGLFACLLLHELSHALVARHYGLEVKGITLFMFGGVAELGEEPVGPGSEFWIAAVGPATSFVLSLAFGLAATASPSPTLAALLDYLALVNLVLAIFNLLPAYPLDGGRILRAVLWRMRRNMLEATRISGAVAQAIAWILVLLGVLSLFGGGSIDAVWLVLVGLFLLSASTGAVRQVEMRAALDGKMVGELMTRRVVTAAPDETLQHLAERAMLESAVSFVPVVENGHLLGFVDTHLLRTIDRELWADTCVDDIFVASDEENTVAPDLSAAVLMNRILAGGPRKVLVARGDTLLGVVTLSDLLHYMRIVEELTRRPALDGL